MHGRLIPPNTKSKTKFILNMTIVEVIIAFISLCLVGITFLTPFFFIIKVIIIIIILLLTSILLMEVGSKRGWNLIVSATNYLTRKNDLASYDLYHQIGVKFTDENSKEEVIRFGDEYTIAIEIMGMDFGIAKETEQDRIINNFANIFKNISSGKLIKTDKFLEFDDYVEKLDEKITYWQEKSKVALEANPNMTEDEAYYYLSRIEVLELHKEALLNATTDNHIICPCFYLLITSKDLATLHNNVNYTTSHLASADMDYIICESKESIRLYERFFDVNGTDRKFKTPKIVEKWSSLRINKEIYKIATISKTPLQCSNAWLATLFRINGTKVVMNFAEDKDVSKTYKSINRSIIELESRMRDKKCREDQKLDMEVNINALKSLLHDLKIGNEKLHGVNVFLLTPAKMIKDVKRVIGEIGIKVDVAFFEQLEDYKQMLPYKNSTKFANNWQSSTLAATFPYVTKNFMDERGMYIGESATPVFYDQFYSWPKGSRKRTNANEFIIGTSGGGKSYRTKLKIMLHLLQGRKVFILDPEIEYDWLCKVFKGNMIDVGGVREGKLNPLQVYPTISDSGEALNSEVTSHKQFLQQFFALTCANLDKSSFPLLDDAISELYEKFNINDETDLFSLDPSHFPTMQDLYELVANKREEVKKDKEEIEYIKIAYIDLCNSLKVFAKGGAWNNIWNGHTSIDLSNDLTVLNFQSLFASSNTVVANAQMLLVMKVLMQEVIANKNNNSKLKNVELYKNVVIAVDEAHQFINPKFPVALEFMAQMVKRIRKYGGGMIITTQNLNDFIGHSDNTKVMAEAVINGCQYATIFKLNPNDLQTLKDLYRGYGGGLGESELDFITNAQRGDALMMVDSTTRFTIHISAIPGTQDYFIEPDYEPEQFDEFNKDPEILNINDINY